MKFLRTASTGRLLAVLTGVVVLIAAGAAIAVAAAGRGPVPKRSSLPAAIHRALSAHAVKAISGTIKFTNGLIDASNFQGSDPLLQGASGRFWISGDHRLRVELQSSNGDAQIVLNGRSFWISDPAQRVVYEGTLPAGTTSAKKGTAKTDSVPTIAAIQSELNKLMGHLNVSGAIPSNVGGQPAYTVRLAPKHDGGLLGQVQLAWDAARGVPLRFAIYARGNPSPVLQLEATSVSYGAVPASDFNVTPPAGSKVVRIATAGLAAHAKGAKRGHHASVTGASAVAQKLPFTLHAPHALIALPRQSVRLLDWGGKPAALLTYGKGLGGIVVIEQTQSAGSSALPSSSQAKGGDGQAGFSLPTVSVHGATGTELDTALGTVIHFSRDGVSYTVLGSVPSFAAEKAARAL